MLYQAPALAQAPNFPLAEFTASGAVSSDRTCQRIDIDADFVVADAGGTWTLLDTIENPGFGSSNTFGTSLSRDGDLLAVGAPNDTSTSPFAGAVYLERFISGSWQPEATLIPSEGTPTDRFGSFVAA
ncbi:MAG: hypothetical protein AAGB93_07535 [Planctomycetota bacterium]